MYSLHETLNTKVEGNVTETTHTEKVLLLPEMFMRAPMLREERILWSFSCSEAKSVESVENVVMRRRLPVVRPVEGRFVREFDVGCVDLMRVYPCCIAMKGDELIVCSEDEIGKSGCVQVCKDDGTLVHQWRVRFLPSAIAVMGDEVIVCSAKHVYVFRMDGMFVRNWKYGACDGTFGVTVSGDEVIMCDMKKHRIRVFRADGTFLRQWGEYGEGHGQFSFMSGVTVVGDDVIVCDSWNNRMQVFKMDGTFVRKWGTQGFGPGQLSHPRGVVVKGGEVIVCGTSNNRMQVFKMDGTFVQEWGTKGRGPGQFDDIWAAVVKGNEVFVCDRSNRRVQVFV